MTLNLLSKQGTAQRIKTDEHFMESNVMVTTKIAICLLCTMELRGVCRTLIKVLKNHVLMLKERLKIDCLEIPVNLTMIAMTTIVIMEFAKQNAK